MDRTGHGTTERGRGQQRQGVGRIDGMRDVSSKSKTHSRMNAAQQNAPLRDAGSMFRNASGIIVQDGPASSGHTPEETPTETPMTTDFDRHTFIPGPGQDDPRFVGIDQTNRNRSPSAPPKTSSDIYYKHIGVQGRGSPLWIPEPSVNLNIEYRRSGIAIGDVGIITEFGAFDFLFNICRPRDHPINPPNLPEIFDTLEISPMDINEYTLFGSGSYISSSTIRKSEQGFPGLTFKTDASEGAILIIPDGSESEDVGNIRHVRQFIAEHAKDWYSYALKVRGRDAKNGDLRVVVGYDKTTAWGMATFSNATSQERPSLLKFLSTGQSRFGAPYQTYFWEISGTAQVRTGPDTSQVESLRGNDALQQGVTYRNQTLFIRTMNITLQQHIWEKVLSGNPGEADVMDTPAESSSSNFLGVHPSKGINEKLLKDDPSSTMAITEDKDWMSLLEGDRVLPTTDEFVSRLKKRKDTLPQSEEGVTYLARDETQSLSSRSAAQTKKTHQSVFQVESPVEIESAKLKDGGAKLKDIVILVMGPTGAGKSTFINYLLPKDSKDCMIVNGSLTSSVADPKAAEIDFFSDHSKVKGRRLLLIDTPGFDDTHQDDYTILSRIADYLKDIHLKQNVLGGVIYLHDVTSDRFSAARSLEILERLTGETALKNVVLGTTKWRRESGGHCQRHESELRNIYWKPLITRGSIMLRFEDSTQSAERFVDTILRRTTDHGIALNVEKELVTQKRKSETQGSQAKEGLFRRIRRFFSFK